MAMPERSVAVSGKREGMFRMPGEVIVQRRFAQFSHSTG